MKTIVDLLLVFLGSWKAVELWFENIPIVTTNMNSDCLIVWRNKKWLRVNGKWSRIS